MKKLSIVNRSLKNGKEFNEEKRILKQSTFIQEIATIMNDPLSMTILNDLYSVSRTSRRNLLILDTACKYEKNERTGNFEWIDYPQVKIKNQGKVDIINIKDLVFAEDHIVVSGFKYSFNDIIITKKYLHYYNLIEETPEELKYEYMYIDEKKIHNIINGHTNRVHVSTLMQFYYYCNDCHTWTDLRDYINYINYFDRTITCPSCGATHHFNDIKFVDVFECIPVYSNIFINKNKITFSYKELNYGLRTNSDNRPFWSWGTHKITMNLETGFSYRMLDGCCHSLLRQQGTDVPKFYNCTYESFRVAYDIQSIARNRIYSLIAKYKDNKKIINLIGRRYCTLRDMILKKELLKVDNYMTNYYTNKFGYNVPHLFDERALNKKNSLSYTGTYQFILKNRLVNLTQKDIKLASLIFDKNRNPKNYKLMDRTAPTLLDIALSYLKGKVSKNLRKDFIKLLTSSEFEDHQRNNFVELMILISKFTNKECQNTMFKNLTTKQVINSGFYRDEEGYYPFMRLPYLSGKDLDLLFKLRDEKYIAKISQSDFYDKMEILRDCNRVIEEIQSILGKDWNPMDLKFKTEKQFHDDLVKILNSDTVREIRISQDNNPFEMEKEIYELEELDNNIHIARKGAELTIIGQQMGICVGGYINAVRDRRCRIAYVTDPVTNEYKVCLELRPVYNKDKNGNVKVTYILNQAKLNSNQLVRNNPEYHKLITEWCDKHHIQIETRDMILPQVQEVNELYF